MADEPTTTTPAPAKSGTTKTPKATAGKASASANSGAIPSLVNPTWAAYVIKKHDLVGKSAEHAIVALSAFIEKKVSKVTTPEKLEKLVLAAMAESYRKARGKTGA